MNTTCPNCHQHFQTIDVDGVMSERKLIHEILEESREVERLRSERTKDLIALADCQTKRIQLSYQRDMLLDALDTLTHVIGLTPIAGNKEALQSAMDHARSLIPTKQHTS